MTFSTFIKGMIDLCILILDAITYAYSRDQCKVRYMIIFLVIAFICWGAMFHFANRDRSTAHQPAHVIQSEENNIPHTSTSTG